MPDIFGNTFILGLAMVPIAIVGAVIVSLFDRD